MQTFYSHIELDFDESHGFHSCDLSALVFGQEFRWRDILGRTALEETEDGGYEQLFPWAVLNLRKASHPKTGPEVCAALRKRLEEAEEERESDPEAEFVSVRMLKAIQYFGGPVRKTEEQFLSDG